MAKHETDYSTKIIAELRKNKEVYIFKYIQSGFSRIGVPDIIMCYKGRFIGIEVKMLGNTYTDQQVYNFTCISRAGGIPVGLFVAPKSKGGAQFNLDKKPHLPKPELTKEERENLEWFPLSELLYQITKLIGS